jgi:phage tail sheath protein FI
MFNLLVRDGGTGVIESFPNLTFKDSPRRIDRVLKNESNLVNFVGTPAGSETIPNHAAPAAGKTVWEDNNASTGVASGGAASDGIALVQNDFTGPGKENDKKGLFALQNADLFNILCIPPYKLNASGLDVESALIGQAAAYCQRRRAFLIVDPPSDWNTKDKAKAGVGAVGTGSNYAALFFPRLRQPNPLRGNQVEDFVPCGAVAGVFARTDATRGVWKAPAGLDATLTGVPQLSVPLNDAENGELNPLGINCLRSLPPAGRVVWGARTLQGDDRLASEWKYIPVRRTALMIEESLYRGTQWVVFEPNDEPLWAQIRLNVGAFMQNLFRQGAFQGRSPREAYFVKCQKETTTQNDINLGIVNIIVGFAPLKPAEFVVIKIQQMAGQVEV